MDNAGIGLGVWDRKGTESRLRGVECESDEVGEGVVRVNDGVLCRVLESGRRNATLRILSTG